MVSLPAEVNSFDPDTQTIEAQPLLKTIYLEDNEKKVADMPPISRVPVLFPEGGGFAIRWTLEPGDRVLLQFVDREMESWLAGQGQQVDPFSRRAHSLDDAVALPLAPRPWSDPLPDLGDGDLVAGRRDGSGALRIKPDGKLELGSDGATKRGVARLNDPTLSDATTDAQFWIWAAALDVAVRAVIAANPLNDPTGSILSALQSAAPSPPTQQVGKINQASTKVSTE